MEAADVVARLRLLQSEEHETWSEAQLLLVTMLTTSKKRCWRPSRQ
ncbi:hypothetical protein PC116_g14403 [Phytophthora cactorum]|uniref:Uncharacterized protein n=1 Tax=Phytophthora cactorum TaxID=29920 RepID=A0A8T1DF61_9STRA|nr:hypothetical protein PC114_g10862 [Phytophthora cactorum]KAG2938449.1 hypothetical protein PC117_g11255 [Phytophthora cactorum]KAG3017590.1 hypothetical protein PC119_g10978 [Phytophthora cactorum]KAG3167039.1 hypothetical protein C6341_g11834 [Phytophthora cactorum]KAG3188191.1 hypothetical protein PC128_g12309 [Phytophthora cactorum]